VTSDGHRIRLLANIELPEDFRTLRRNGAEGVGLYRTEFLYINRPAGAGEDEQLAIYRRVLRATRGAPITIRTLDLGADKETGDGRSGPMATNPALGLRALRRCLRHPELFVTQLKAILRAAAYGPVRLMFPMLTSVAELEQALSYLEQARRELVHEGQRHGDPAIGGMIEVPAAALSAHMFARRLDFLSIGTNDLIQYTLAIDRLDDEVNYLYDPLHPAVLRLIHMTLQAGKKAGIPVAMCGEMAAVPRYTRLLLGLGLTEFSMQPSSLLEVKRVVNASSLRDAERIGRQLLRSAGVAETTALMQRLNQGLTLSQ
jgi:phosphotransferase system enzyme I (PtsI)